MTVEPQHLRIDVALAVSRAQARHHAECPDIGPICAVRAEPPQEHHTTLWVNELKVLAEYGIFKRLAVQAVVPVRIVDTRTRYTDLNGAPKTLDYPNIHHLDGVLAGFSDPQLLAHSGFALGALRVSGKLGISLPVGQVTEDPYRLGAEGKEHQHIQFGTGSVDPLLGLDATWASAAWSASAFGRVRAPLYAGRNGYRAGTQINGGAVLATPVGGSGLMLRMSVVAAHELAETWGGTLPVEDGNRGRTDVFFGFGATFPFAGDWSASLDVNARVWGQTAGAQLDLPVVLQLSIGRLFHLEGTSHEEFASSGGDVADVVLAGEVAPLVAEPGRWTVFDFWAPWCEACRTLDRDLRELAAVDPRVVVRRVNIVDFDSPIAARELPGVAVLPRVRLVGPSGTVVFEESGPPDALFTLIRDALAAQPAVFSCPMHPEVRRDAAGTCPTCGMPLMP